MAIVKVRAGRIYHRGVVSAIACLTCQGEGNVPVDGSFPPMEVACAPCRGTGMADINRELEYLKTLPDIPKPGRRRRGGS